MDEIRKRIERLERQNRRFRAAGIGSVLLVSSIFIMGQAFRTPRFVEAEGFILKDPTGRITARLLNKIEGPALSLFDRNQKERLKLTVTPVGASLFLYDSKGDTVALLGQMGFGSTLSLWDKKRSIKLSATRIVSGMVVYDSKGNQRVGLGYMAGFPFMALYNNLGKSKLVLSMAKNQPKITMLNQRGMAFWSAPEPKAIK